MLLGTGDHGDPVDDPDSLDDLVDEEHLARVARLMANRAPDFADADFTAGWTGPYDITPDWNPVVGAVPGVDGLSRRSASAVTASSSPPPSERRWPSLCWESSRAGLSRSTRSRASPPARLWKGPTA